MYGLVLEGGGAKGAYQIGAYKALVELGIEVSGIAGTSIGALNGALIVQDELEKAYELWYNISPSQVFDIDEERYQELKNLEFSQDNLFYFMNKAKEIWNNRGIDITYLRKLLQDHINEQKLRSSTKDFGIITINLSEMRPLELFLEDIPEGKVTEYLIASAYLPAFKQEKVDGKFFLDGGFYDNLPINLLLKKGYKQFITIRTGALGRKRKIASKSVEIITIKPQEDLGMVLDFDQENARKNLQLGYFDALRVMRNLKGRRYYLYPKGDEGFYLHFLMNLGEERILKVGKLFGIEGVPYKRLLFEFILPKLATLLEIDQTADYEDLVIRLLEAVAEEYQVDRFRIYTFDELMDALAAKQTIVGRKVPRHIPTVMKKFDILAKTVKEEVIKEVIFELFGGVFSTDRLMVSAGDSANYDQA